MEIPEESKERQCVQPQFRIWMMKLEIIYLLKVNYTDL